MGNGRHSTASSVESGIQPGEWEHRCSKWQVRQDCRFMQTVGL